MEEVKLLERKLERERLARKAAESILEERALQLYESNEKLRKLNNELEIKVEKRASQLIKNEEKYRQIIENMELGLLEVDNDQLILKAYDWFCDMTGYSQEELVGKNAAEVFIYDQRHARVINQEQKHREKGQAGIYEIQIKHKQGHPIWVMISASPVYNVDGKVIGSIGIHYDITRQKKLQKALLEAKKTAENAQKAEQLFLAKMSHEIRTPLNAIIGMSHLLKATGPTQEQKDYLKILGDSSNILKLLISDILDFSKIQAGEIRIQKNEFDIKKLVAGIKNAIQAQIEGKDVKITSQIDPRIQTQLIGDKTLLNQILINLVGNARKFTKKGSINISVEVGNEYENEFDLLFNVSDTGIGFGPDKKEIIFQNFKQISDEEQNELNGTGLGLAITKQLVELQGGKIDVDSIINKGSTFKVSIKYKKGGPINSDVDNDLLIDKNKNKIFRDQKILVVEDNYMNRKYILTLLSKWNLEYAVAKDGIEAIEISNQEKFDLIFMDISMPRLNGYQATERIRSENNLNQFTPIIALSASAFVTKKERALAIGMTDFLCKPFDPQNLFEVIAENILNNSNNIIAQKKNEEIIFPEPLDSLQLYSLYEGNWSLAKEMFSIFLSDVLPAFLNFEVHTTEKDFKAIKNLAHKLASNLAMIGLMKSNKRLLQIEELANEEKDIEQIKIILSQVNQELKTTKPILEECLLLLNNVNPCSKIK